jgi:hypothetical protein
LPVYLSFTDSEESRARWRRLRGLPVFLSFSALLSACAGDRLPRTPIYIQSFMSSVNTKLFVPFCQTCEQGGTTSTGGLRRRRRLFRRHGLAVEGINPRPPRAHFVARRGRAKNRVGRLPRLQSDYPRPFQVSGPFDAGSKLLAQSRLRQSGRNESCKLVICGPSSQVLGVQRLAGAS